MFLYNPAGPIDLGGSILNKGEVREFSSLEAEDLIKRYPKLEVVRPVRGNGKPPKVITDAVAPKKRGRPAKVGAPKKTLKKKK